MVDRLGQNEEMGLGFGAMDSRGGCRKIRARGVQRLIWDNIGQLIEKIHGIIGSCRLRFESWLCYL